jgi:GtrA-like protein.
MNMLLEMAHSKIPFINVPIETVYLENNNSSHFHPIRDSVIIYYNILKYSLSSLVSAAADLSLFTFFVHIIFGSSNTGILASTAMARLMSGGLNFTLNKYWVFNSKKRNTYEALMYFVLFCCQMLLSWLLVSGLSSLPISLTLIKIFVDTGLFFINYLIQRNFIFNPKKREAISQ